MLQLLIENSERLGGLCKTGVGLPLKSNESGHEATVSAFQLAVAESYFVFATNVQTQIPFSRLLKLNY